MFSEDFVKWNEYVSRHPQATVYHRWEFLSAIEEAYGHKPYFLVAYRENGPHCNALDSSHIKSSVPKGELRVELLSSDSQMNDMPLAGVLPLVAIKNLIFGKSLTSIPFFDLAGVLADDPECERMLVSEARQIMDQSKLDRLDLRHAQPMTWLQDEIISGAAYEMKPGMVTVAMNKVRMILDLPDSSEKLMKSFKSKLRSQINKPLKGGLTYSCGGLELLDDFYKVFLINMRDLGSPIHSKRLIQSVLEKFPKESQIFIVRQEAKPAAVSLVLGFKESLCNPWASSLREYSSLSPNMLLYWAMLEYACDNGYKFFDFGRSTSGEGTCRFKEQWGARPKPLYWYTISSKGKSGQVARAEKDRMSMAVELWKRLPLPVTRILGPGIRKYISL